MPETGIGLSECRNYYHHADSVDVKQAARILCVSESALRLWKRQGRGPDYFRAGRLLRYRRSDLDQWIENNSVSGQKK